MSRLLVLCFVLAWAGAALLLAQVRWLARPSLATRLKPYAPPAARRRSAAPDGEGTLRDLAAPLARDVGATVARLAGVAEPLERRLARVHSPLDVTGFRLRQAGWAALALLVAAAATLVLRPPLGLVPLVLAGAPLLGFLLPEQRLAGASRRWQQRLFLELPVVEEQLGMLLSSGWSLPAGLARLAERGQGAAAADLARVVGRVRQGLGEAAALREWAEVAGLDEVRRLVSILCLSREAADIGPMISDEARAVRREAHRRLLATLDQRAQAVWIPVTVAALVPGVIFVAIPFLEVMRLFGGR